MKIAINGFGRIGRLFLRQAWGRPELEIVAINDLGDIANLAYLLKHDSVYRTWDHEVSADPASGTIRIDGKSIAFVSQKDAAQLPWKDMGIDVVIEATGVFESFEKAQVHIAAGARRVLITAPAKDADGEIGVTSLVGISGKDDTHPVVSNASCTTNAASPVIAVLHQALGVQKAVLNTVHAYTATQSIVDGPVKGEDFRRGRAAAQNIVPSTTGAAKAVSRVLPDLTDRFDGIAIRVPVVSGSLVDVTFVASRPTTKEEVNELLKSAAQSDAWKGILGYSDEQLVSSDIIGMPYGSIVDGQFTKVIGGDLVKVLAWYDNEWGYVSTLIKQVLRM